LVKQGLYGGEQKGGRKRACISHPLLEGAQTSSLANEESGLKLRRIVRLEEERSGGRGSHSKRGTQELRKDWGKENQSHEPYQQSEKKKIRNRKDGGSSTTKPKQEFWKKEESEAASVL